MTMVMATMGEEARLVAVATPTVWVATVLAVAMAMALEVVVIAVTGAETLVLMEAETLWVVAGRTAAVAINVVEVGLQGWTTVAVPPMRPGASIYQAVLGSVRASDGSVKELQVACGRSLRGAQEVALRQNAREPAAILARLKSQHATRLGLAMGYRWQ